jgi:hypothetical protein
VGAAQPGAVPDRKKGAVDDDWQEYAKLLIDFCVRPFTVLSSGTLMCGEQDYDKASWGGIASTFGAVLTNVLGCDRLTGV